MIRGLLYKTPNQWGYILRDIFEGIYVEKYYWEIKESIIIEKNNIPRFSGGWCDGENFKKLLSAPPSYLPHFVDYRAYCDKDVLYKIKTYEEFVNSPCELILLITDCLEVYIYVKDKEILKKLMANALKIGCKNIEYITDENDGRTEIRAI